MLLLFLIVVLVVYRSWPQKPGQDFSLYAMTLDLFSYVLWLLALELGPSFPYYARVLLHFVGSVRAFTQHLL